MDKKFLTLGITTVFADTRQGGLLCQFMEQYQQRFPEEGTLLPNCSYCKSKYWNNYIKLFEMKNSETPKYKLKIKYNGIAYPFGSSPMRNGFFTDAEAIKLAKDHPFGKDLFEIFTEPQPKKVAPKKSKKVAPKKTK